MATAFDVADYIVSWFGRKPRGENDLSQLKLQKLLYYCQGHYFAWAGEPLFDDEIEAWEHGPVVRDVYIAFNAHVSGSEVITPHTGGGTVPGSTHNVDAKTKEFLRQVLEVRGQYSAWRLREMTHKETPWVTAYVEGQKNVIPKQALADYFKQFVR